MPRVDHTPYHCCFLLDKQSSMLNMAIAWKRVGNYDYGLYLTKRQGQEDYSPLCTLFKATYSQYGEIVSFHVKDGLIETGAGWDDDHIKPGGRKLLVEQSDIEQVELLAGSFLGDWLESFGQSDALSVLRRLGAVGAAQKDAWRNVIQSGLPAEIKKTRLPDVLSCAEPTEHGFLYAFVPYPERVGMEDATNALLEAKMRIFFELL